MTRVKKTKLNLLFNIITLRKIRVLIGNFFICVGNFFTWTGGKDKEELSNEDKKLRVYICNLCQNTHFSAEKAIRCCICSNKYKVGDFIRYNVPVPYEVNFEALEWISRMGGGVYEFYWIITEIERSEAYTRYSIRTRGISSFLKQGWVLEGDREILRAHSVPIEVREEGQKYIGERYIVPLAER